MTARCSAVAIASAASQSTTPPSAIDSASGNSAAASGLLTAHLLCQAQQRATHGHARGIRRRLAQSDRDLLKTSVHLDSRDDRFPLLRTEPLQRRLVAIDGLYANRRLQRRRRAIALVVVQ